MASMTRREKFWRRLIGWVFAPTLACRIYGHSGFGWSCRKGSGFVCEWCEHEESD